MLAPRVGRHARRRRALSRAGHRGRRGAAPARRNRRHAAPPVRAAGDRVSIGYSLVVERRDTYALRYLYRFVLRVVASAPPARPPPLGAPTTTPDVESRRLSKLLLRWGFEVGGDEPGVSGSGGFAAIYALTVVWAAASLRLGARRRAAPCGGLRVRRDLARAAVAVRRARARVRAAEQRRVLRARGAEDRARRRGCRSSRWRRIS